MQTNNNQQDGAPSNAPTSSACGLILLDTNQLENLLRLYITLEELSTNSFTSLYEKDKVISNENETMKQTSQQTDLFHNFKHQNDSNYPTVDTTTIDIFPTNVESISIIDNPYGKLPTSTLKQAINSQTIVSPSDISHNSTRRKSIPFICSTLESIREEQEIKKSQPKRPRGRPRKNSFEIKNETKRLKLD